MVESHVYKHYGDVCEVVRQLILGVVSNVIHCFVTNLTDFPAVKEF